MCYHREYWHIELIKLSSLMCLNSKPRGIHCTILTNINPLAQILRVLPKEEKLGETICWSSLPHSSRCSCLTRIIYVYQQASKYTHPTTAIYLWTVCHECPLGRVTHVREVLVEGHSTTAGQFVLLSGNQQLAKASLLTKNKTFRFMDDVPGFWSWNEFCALFFLAKHKFCRKVLWKRGAFNITEPT